MLHVACCVLYVTLTMIAYLKGTIKNKGQGYIILEAGHIGYQVFINPVFYSELSINQELEVYTHQHVREDALDLYGFVNLEQLEMFELLLSISGIGPKSALGALAVAGVDELKETIAQGDPSLLTKVSGIGKKTAERIVLELREKVGSLAAGTGRGHTGASTSGDEIDALVALGYSTAQAREALRGVDPALKDSSARIKEALKKLG